MIGVPILLIGALSYSLVSFGVLALLAHQGRPALSGLRATTSVAIRALPPAAGRAALPVPGPGDLARLRPARGLAIRRGARGLRPPVLDHPDRGPASRAQRAVRARPGARAGGGRAADPRGSRWSTPASGPPRLRSTGSHGSTWPSPSSSPSASGSWRSAWRSALAFMVFGLLIVDRQLTEEWVGERPERAPRREHLGTRGDRERGAGAGGGHPRRLRRALLRGGRPRRQAQPRAVPGRRAGPHGARDGRLVVLPRRAGPPDHGAASPGSSARDETLRRRTTPPRAAATPRSACRPGPAPASPASRRSGGRAGSCAPSPGTPAAAGRAGAPRPRPPRPSPSPRRGGRRRGRSSRPAMRPEQGHRLADREGDAREQVALAGDPVGLGQEVPPRAVVDVHQRQARVDDHSRASR